MAEPLSPNARPSRRPLLWVGALLWTTVFTALGAMFFLRGDRSEPATNLIAVGDGGAGGREFAPGGVKPVQESIYDPKGLPKFSLTERRGATVTNETLKGSPFIAGFVFTRCASKCPKVTAAMGALRKPLKGTGTKLVTFTVDPEYDTPQILTNYADFYDAKDDKDWLFLTGGEDAIYTLIGDGFKQPVSRNEDAADPGWAVFHTFNLMLVGPDGVVRGKYNSQNATQMAKLRHDAKKLAAENASERDESVDGGADA